jgi:hypothetical protein
VRTCTALRVPPLQRLTRHRRFRLKIHVKERFHHGDGYTFTVRRPTSVMNVHTLRPVPKSSAWRCFSLTPAPSPAKLYGSLDTTTGTLSGTGVARKSYALKVCNLRAASMHARESGLPQQSP